MPDEDARADCRPVQVTHIKDREGSQDAQGLYSGVALAEPVTPCGNQWTKLETTLHLPPANATVNGESATKPCMSLTLLLRLAVAFPSRADWSPVEDGSLVHANG